MSVRFSPDGAFWWDGSQWQLALSPDGRWRWDGSRWLPAGAPARVAAPAAIAPAAATPIALQPSPPPAAPAPAVPHQDTTRSRPPPGPRVPSVWTRPLQFATAAYLVATAAAGVTGSAVIFLGGRSALQTQFVKSYAGSGLSAQDAQGLAETVTSVVVAGGLGATLVFAAVFLLLAGAGFRGWAWVYFVDLVLAALGAAGVASSFGSLLTSDPFLPLWLRLLALLIGGTGIALGILMVVALMRFGIWASARLPVTPEPVEPVATPSPKRMR